MLTHLKIQYFLGLGLSILILLYHFSTRIVLGFNESLKNFEFQRSFPYLFAVIAVYYLIKLRNNRNKSYDEFIENSPGRKIDTSAIRYGVGHGFHKKNKSE